ncbi:MAG: hypothetical protein K6B45_08675 [Bacteroidaceae bacterium]|nr:hypothetical protein [Bacteroidaceae bacterium]
MKDNVIIREKVLKTKPPAQPEINLLPSAKTKPRLAELNLGAAENTQKRGDSALFASFSLKKVRFSLS